LNIPKNFLTRVITGAVFVSVLLFGIIYSQYTFAIVMCTVACLALYEYHTLIDTALNIKANKLFNLFGCILSFAGMFAFFSGLLPSVIALSPYICFLLTLFISELYLKKDNPIQSLAYSILGQIYIVIPFSFLNPLAFGYHPNGEYHFGPLLALFIIIWVNDSFAYIFGVTLGKHRLFERISPKKSWEGFIGGAICAILSSLVFAHYLGQMSTAQWIGFAVIVVVFGTLGDLIESLLKRTLKVKDSGNILPGHGGILDRFDSMIFAIPALFVYIGLVAYFKGSGLL